MIAEVAKLVDARDSKSRGSDTVSVRVRPSAPFFLVIRAFMLEKDCIFCKIIQKEIPSKVIKENDKVLVVEDASPKAPIHYLIIPKKHIVNLNYIKPEDNDFLLDILKMSQELAKDIQKSKGLDNPLDFNLIVNNGANAGQSVFHIHFHFIAEKNIYLNGLEL